MTSTTYSITSAPKRADFYETNCQICGHEELRKPIWLRSSNGVTFPAGSTCAAKALYGNDYASTKTRVRNLAEVAQASADRAETLCNERKVAYAAALATFNADGHDANLQNARRTYHTVKPGCDFPTYLARVAQTGEI